MISRFSRRGTWILTAAVLLGGLSLGGVVRVPPGRIGVTPDAPPRVLDPGFHLRRPFTPVVLYTLDPVSLRGAGETLTREGARVPVTWTLRVRLDLHAGIAPAPAGRDGDPGARLEAAIAAIVEEELEAPAAGTPLRDRLAAALARHGLDVEDLIVREAAAGRATPPLDHPIAIVGLDGVDWQILDPLIAAGKVPHLARLKDRAAWGTMRSSEPILSPLLWTTVVTGKTPDEHGIIDFLVPDPSTGKKIPITSRSRRVRALWNIFSERGLEVDVVAWWATWPAEAIRGRMITDRVAYSLFDVAGAMEGLTWPQELHADLGAHHVSGEDVPHEEIARFIDITPAEYERARSIAVRDPGASWRDPILHLGRIIAATRTYHAMTLDLVSRGQPDLLLVYYQGIDEVSHRFAHFMPPKMRQVREEEFRKFRGAVEAFYIWQDELLGGLIAALDPASTLIVLSDHGFHNGPSRPTDAPADIEGKPGKWHRLYGVVMIAGEGIPAGRIDTATLLDVTPTVLALADLPPAADMPGRALVRRPGESGPAAIATYETPVDPPARGGDPAPARIAAADEELLRNLESLGYIGRAAPDGTAGEAPATAAAGTVTSHTNLAAVLLRKGDLAGAERELREALRRRPGYFPALMSLAQTLVRQGRHDEALETTRIAVTAVPAPEPGAYVQFALLARRAGRQAQAGDLLRSLASRRGPSAGIETAFGVIAAADGDESSAVRRYRAALAIDPAFPEAMARLFDLLRRRGREVECEPDVRRALAANDRSVMHHNWLGLILERKGDRGGAEASFRRALDLAPDFGGTMTNLGSFYGRGGRLEEAVAILTRAVGIDPLNLEARVNLGAALAKLGRLEEAIRNLEEARALGLRSSELLNAVGLAYAESGRTGQAIEALTESLALSPDQPRVRDLIRELTPPT